MNNTEMEGHWQSSWGRGLFGPLPAMRSRMGWLILVVLLGTYLALAAWVMKGHPQPGWFSDSVFYLATADVYSGRVGEHAFQFATEFYKTSRYPPLFPWTLSLFGGGLESTQNAYCVVLGFGFLAVLGAFAWLRQETGCALSAALLLPAAMWSPGLFLINLEILSESQFVALLVAVFILVTYYERGQCGLATLCLVASVVPLSRTVGIALLAALTIWLVFVQRRRSLFARSVAVTGLWLPTVLWMYYRSKLPIVLGYSADLTAPLKQGASTWLWSLVERLPGMAKGYAYWFSLGETQFAIVTTALMLSFALVGWCVRIRRLRPDAMFLVIYLGLVIAWPYPFEMARLLAVSMPVIALCAWQGVQWIWNSLSRPGAENWSQAVAVTTVFVATLAMSGPRWLDVWQRTQLSADPELQQAMRNQTYFKLPIEVAKLNAESMTRVTRLIQAMPDVVAPKDCVWTPFYALTAYLSEFRVELRLTPDEVTPGNAATKLAACRYILLTSLNAADLTRMSLYPAESVRGGKPVLYAENNFQGRVEIAAALIDLRN